MKIKKGDHITITGVKNSPGPHHGIVETAENWSDAQGDDWYIQFKCDDCQAAHYWKQRQDGGTVELDIPHAENYARQLVRFELNLPGDKVATSHFTHALIETFLTADILNFARLAQVYPEYARAINEYRDTGEIK